MQPVVKDNAVSAEVADFILTLIQAFTKTGYYMPDHPETEKATSGLYDMLQHVLKDRSEISFLAVTDTRGGSDAFIVGLTDDPLPVRNLMMKGMADVFVSRFVDYLERKHLSAFTLKKSISQPEFAKFIAIMTESPYGKEKENVQEKLTLDLIKNQIVSVSTVFNVDLVGKGRKLPWRVDMALSRLKRDLNMIPLFKQISKEKMDEIRRMIFEDIVRPLSSPEITADILKNLDLIHANISGFDAATFEDRTIGYLKLQMLPEVALYLVDEFTRLKKTFDQVQSSELQGRLDFLVRISKKVCMRLFKMETVNEKLLSRFVQCEIVRDEEIPQAIRKKVLKHVALDRFLKSPEKFFQQIKEASDPVEIRDKVLLSFEFLPTLFAMGRFPDILEIIMLSTAKKVPFDINKNAALMASISHEVRNKIPSAPKEKQLEFLSILAGLGAMGDYLAVDLLDNDSRFMRRQLLKLLENKGPGITRYVLAAEKQKNNWFFLRNALIVLSKAGVRNPEVEDLFTRALQHAEGNVRKEAIIGVSMILKKDGESLLLPILNDADIEMRKRAATALAELGCKDPELLECVIGLLTGHRETDAEQLIEMVSSLNVPEDASQRLEEVLIDLIKGPSLLARITREAQPPSGLKKAAIDLLGKIGSQKAIKALNGYSHRKDPALSEAALSAAEKIRGRAPK